MNLQGRFISKPESLREGGGRYNPEKRICTAGCFKRSLGGPETSVKRHSQTEVTSLGQIWGNKYLEFTLLPPYLILLALPIDWKELETIGNKSCSCHPHRAICFQEQKVDEEVGGEHIRQRGP